VAVIDYGYSFDDRVKSGDEKYRRFLCSIRLVVPG
jgi:hypothetical protein